MQVAECKVTVAENAPQADMQSVCVTHTAVGRIVTQVFQRQLSLLFVLIVSKSSGLS